jgi:hypothetical protein
MGACAGNSTYQRYFHADRETGIQLDAIREVCKSPVTASATNGANAIRALDPGTTIEARFGAFKLANAFTIVTALISPPNLLGIADQLIFRHVSHRQHDTLRP